MFPSLQVIQMQVLMCTGDGALSSSLTDPCAVPGCSPLKPRYCCQFAEPCLSLFLIVHLKNTDPGAYRVPNGSFPSAMGGIFSLDVLYHFTEAEDFWSVGQQLTQSSFSQDFLQSESHFWKLNLGPEAALSLPFQAGPQSIWSRLIWKAYGW